MKCDFCDKKAIGYVSMQAAIYCGEHQTKAEEIESLMWAEHDKVQHETMNADHDRIVAELQAEVELLRYELNQLDGERKSAWMTVETHETTIARQARVIEELKDVVTCVGCDANEWCPYAWDGYNTNGDCLADK